MKRCDKGEGLYFSLLYIFRKKIEKYDVNVQLAVQLTGN